MVKTMVKQTLSITVSAFVLAIISNVSHAAPEEDLADQPLSLATVVKPNILLLLDDSRSMEKTNLIASEAQTATDIDGEEVLENTRRLAISDLSLYQLCVGFNKLAYNPDINYEVWADYSIPSQTELNHADHGFSLFATGQEGGADRYKHVLVTQYNRGSDVNSALADSLVRNLTEDFYINWNDASGADNGTYNVGECGNALSNYDTGYDPGSTDFIRMAGSSTTALPKGVFYDIDSTDNGVYVAGDSATLKIDVPDTAADDELYFRIHFVALDVNPTHILKISAVDAVNAPIANGIEMLVRGYGTAVPDADKYSLSGVYDTTDGVYELIAANNFGVRGVDFPGDKSISEFKAKSNKFIIEFDTGTFDASTNSNGGRGFYIAWHHASALTSGATAIPFDEDGALTKDDCSNHSHCVTFDSLPDPDIALALDSSERTALISAGPTPSKPFNTKRNYAIWYAYHRTRENIAKKAMADLVVDNQ